MEGKVHELAGDAVGLLINVGIIDSISHRWPEDVQQRWADRLESYSQMFQTQVQEVQEFASSWDDD